MIVEIDISKPPFERSNYPQRPSRCSGAIVDLRVGGHGARAGIGAPLSARRRALARGYRLRAGQRSRPSYRMLCAKEIVAIAGVIPQATPAPPPYEAAGDSRGPD
jgi:hypothetical protein